jgi:hypothetical protein
MSGQRLRASIAMGAIALAASVAVEQLGESQRAARIDDAARATAQIDAADSLIGRRATLIARRAQLRAELGTALHGVDATSRVASFIRDVARIANRHRTTIASIVPQGTPGAAFTQAAPNHTLPTTSAPATGMPRTTPVEPLAFDVTLEGEYPDVLATLGDLATLTYPADAALTSIARRNPHAVEATVSAAIRVTLDAPADGEPA